MKYTTIAYQLTNKCNAQCKMCCYSSTPQSSARLDRDVLLRSIDSIKDTPDIISVGVTGGEPFMYPDDVFAVAECTKKINRQFTLTTNAFWCDSYSHTFDVLSSLKKNNLCICLVSTDTFHEEYMPIECVKNFLRACKELRIPVKVQTNSTKSTFSRTDEIIENLGIDKLHTEIHFGASYPVGMAKKHLEQGEFFTRKLERALCVYRQVLFISAHGRALPCCSPCNASLPFEFGNIYFDTVSDILQKINGDELMHLIVREGFSELLKEATAELGYNKLTEYSDACQVCNHLLSDTERYTHLKKKANDWRKYNEAVSTICW